MNKEAQEKLDSILQKGINSLTPGDIVFLRARCSYLTKAEKKKYSKVLVEKPKAKVKVEKAESEVPPKEEKKPSKKK